MTENKSNRTSTAHDNSSNRVTGRLYKRRFSVLKHDARFPLFNSVHQQVDIAESLLVVRLFQAMDLKASDINGLSDPYVYLMFNGKRYKSSVQSKTLSPEWNETFFFKEEEEGDFDEGDSLFLVFMDHDIVGNDDFLGAMQLPLWGILREAEKVYHDSISAPERENQLQEEASNGIHIEPEPEMMESQERKPSFRKHAKREADSSSNSEESSQSDNIYFSSSSSDDEEILEFNDNESDILNDESKSVDNEVRTYFFRSKPQWFPLQRLKIGGHAQGEVRLSFEFHPSRESIRRTNHASNSTFLSLESKYIIPINKKEAILATPKLPAKIEIRNSSVTSRRLLRKIIRKQQKKQHMDKKVSRTRSRMSDEFVLKERPLLNVIIRKASFFALSRTDANFFVKFKFRDLEMETSSKKFGKLKWNEIFKLGHGVDFLLPNDFIVLSLCSKGRFGRAHVYGSRKIPLWSIMSSTSSAIVEPRWFCLNNLVQDPLEADGALEVVKSVSFKTASMFRRRSSSLTRNLEDERFDNFAPRLLIQISFANPYYLPQHPLPSFLSGPQLAIPSGKITFYEMMFRVVSVKNMPSAPSGDPCLREYYGVVVCGGHKHSTEYVKTFGFPVFKKEMMFNSSSVGCYDGVSYADTILIQIRERLRSSVKDDLGDELHNDDPTATAKSDQKSLRKDYRLIGSVVIDFPSLLNYAGFVDIDGKTVIKTVDLVLEKSHLSMNGSQRQDLTSNANCQLKFCCFLKPIAEKRMVQKKFYSLRFERLSTDMASTTPRETILAASVGEDNINVIKLSDSMTSSEVNVDLHLMPSEDQTLELHRRSIRNRSLAYMRQELQTLNEQWLQMIPEMSQREKVSVLMSIREVIVSTDLKPVLGELIFKPVNFDVRSHHRLHKALDDDVVLDNDIKISAVLGDFQWEGAPGVSEPNSFHAKVHSMSDCLLINISDAVSEKELGYGTISIFEIAEAATLRWCRDHAGTLESDAERLIPIRIHQPKSNTRIAGFLMAGLEFKEDVFGGSLATQSNVESKDYDHSSIRDFIHEAGRFGRNGAWLVGTPGRILRTFLNWHYPDQSMLLIVAVVVLCTVPFLASRFLFLFPLFAIFYMLRGIERRERLSESLSKEKLRETDTHAAVMLEVEDIVLNPSVFPDVRTLEVSVLEHDDILSESKASIVEKRQVDPLYLGKGVKLTDPINLTFPKSTGCYDVMVLQVKYLNVSNQRLSISNLKWIPKVKVLQPQHFNRETKLQPITAQLAKNMKHSIIGDRTTEDIVWKKVWESKTGGASASKSIFMETYNVVELPWSEHSVVSFMFESTTSDTEKKQIYAFLPLDNLLEDFHLPFLGEDVNSQIVPVEKCLVVEEINHGSFRPVGKMYVSININYWARKRLEALRERYISPEDENSSRSTLNHGKTVFVGSPLLELYDHEISEDSWPNTPKMLELCVKGSFSDETEASNQKESLIGSCRMILGSLFQFVHLRKMHLPDPSDGTRDFSIWMDLGASRNTKKEIELWSMLTGHVYEETSSTGNFNEVASDSKRRSKRKLLKKLGKTISDHWKHAKSLDGPSMHLPSVASDSSRGVASLDIFEATNHDPDQGCPSPFGKIKVKVSVALPEASCSERFRHQEKLRKAESVGVFEVGKLYQMFQKKLTTVTRILNMFNNGVERGKNLFLWVHPAKTQFLLRVHVFMLLFFFIIPSRIIIMMFILYMMTEYFRPTGVIKIKLLHMLHLVPTDEQLTEMYQSSNLLFSKVINDGSTNKVEFGKATPTHQGTKVSSVRTKLKAMFHIKSV